VRGAHGHHTVVWRRVPGGAAGGEITCEIALSRPSEGGGSLAPGGALPSAEGRHAVPPATQLIVGGGYVLVVLEGEEVTCLPAGPDRGGGAGGFGGLPVWYLANG